MKKLVIAEKPSLARSIIEALSSDGEKFVKKEEWYESNNYYITSAFGHIFQLCDIEDYIDTGGWKLDYLPFKPEKYNFKLKKDTAKRFKAIKELILDSECVYNAGDPDREGQIIIDIILKQLATKIPVKRLWLKDQTEKVVLKAFREAKDNKEYDLLYKEGMTRLIADWDYGINLTRYATIKTNSYPPLRIGRVKGAIVKAIFDREEEIKNFKKEKYYQVISKEATKDTIIELIHKDKYSEDETLKANKLVAILNSEDAIVSNIEKKERIVNPKKLFSQTSLQNFMNKKYGFAPDKTLSLTQSLYEKKLTSYPRTDTEYLTSAEKDMAKDVIKAHNQDNLMVFKDTKKVFDDKKVNAHSAITPTSNTLSNDVKLTDDEAKCYNEILLRFKENFYKDEAIDDETILTINIGDEVFTKKGRIIKVLGFRSLSQNVNDEDEDETTSKLPPLNIGDKINTNFKKVEKETLPPKPYTVETLNNYLKSPFVKEKDNDEELYKNILEGLEIGTEATRAGIIKELVKGEYIALKKSTYSTLDKGKYLISVSDKLNIDMSATKTAYFGKMLTGIRNGNVKINEALNEVHKEIESIISSEINIEDIAHNRTAEKEVIAACPICSSNIYENSKAFSCSNKDCHVVLFKEDKYFATMGKKITKTMAKDLFTKGSVYVKGIKGKNGNYNCTITAVFTEKYPKYERKF